MPNCWPWCVRCWSTLRTNLVRKTIWKNIIEVELNILRSESTWRERTDSRPWGEVIECILMRPTRLQRNWWHEGAWSSMATVKFRLCAGKKKYQIQFESRVGINRLSLADWKQHRAAAPANLEKNKQWKPFCIHHSVCVSHPDAFFAVFSLFFCSFARSNNGQRHTPHIQPRLRQNGFDFWIMS